jgi:hypothetical protein
VRSRAGMCRVSAVSLCAALCCCSYAADGPLITYAEAPVRLIRDTHRYIATPGVVLQAGDLLESGESGMQVEGIGASIIATGPHTRIGIGLSGPPTDIVLLSGWLKIQTKQADPVSATAVSMHGLVIAPGTGTVIIHSTPAEESAFSEAGTHLVTELGARRQLERQVKFGAESYISRKSSEQLKSAARPERDFLASVPFTFRDPLIGVAEKIKTKTTPKFDQPVTYNDVGEWLTSNVGAGQRLVSRFKPRLKDKVFREQLDAALGQTADWKPILHPAPVIIKKIPSAYQPPISGSSAGTSNPQ